MSTRDRIVLVVDDEAATRKLVAMNLEKRGFRIFTARDGTEALRIFNTYPIELVILDLNIPPPNGFDICARIRAESDVPIVVLSADGSQSSKIQILELGADDYITKPFGIPEMMARVDAALRRTQIKDDVAERIYESGNLVLDFKSRHVIRDGRMNDLTPTEYRLLKQLVQREGEVLAYRTILRSVWGPSSSNDRDYLRSYIYKLRRKIEKDPKRPVHLLSASGTGYCFAR